MTLFQPFFHAITVKDMRTWHSRSFKTDLEFLQTYHAVFFSSFYFDSIISLIDDSLAATMSLLMLSSSQVISVKALVIQIPTSIPLFTSTARILLYNNIPC
ncbi:hypothetical protein V6Z12_A08G005900 [Gossypium hirsutum]|nr:hypothetical protein ES288_A08G006000v1 [Gossypium darwinii]